MLDQDLENDSATAEVDADLNGKSKKVNDDDTDGVSVTIAAKDKADEAEEETLETESWSDDPVRMYLTQMGEIPLLTRQEEINLARRIENTRTSFRRRLLACDYVIRAAYKVLLRVHRGELPFDRTVQVSVTDSLEKEQILGR